jgi:branched-chain amino acid transport system substrate-binding protein
MTGGYASLGTVENKGAKLAEKVVNDAGGINGHPLKIIYADAGTLASEAAVICKKFITTDKVLAIVGFSSTGCQNAAQPLQEEAKTPVIYTSGGFIWDKSMKYGYPSLGAGLLDSQMGTVKWLKEAGYSHLGLLATSDATGDVIEIGIKKGMEALGGMNLDIARFGPQDKDVTGQLSELKSKGVQAIVVGAGGAASATCIKNWSLLGVNVPIVIHHGMGAPTFRQLIADFGVGVWIFADLPTVYYEVAKSPQRDLVEQINKKYTDMWNEEMDGFLVGHGYDGVMCVVEAIKAAKLDPTKMTVEEMRGKINSTLEQQTYVGMVGKITRSPSDHEGLEFSVGTEPGKIATMYMAKFGSDKIWHIIWPKDVKTR